MKKTGGVRFERTVKITKHQGKCRFSTAHNKMSVLIIVFANKVNFTAFRRHEFDSHHLRLTSLGEKIPPVRGRKKKKKSPLGSPDVSYSLPAIKRDKERAPSPSPASPLAPSLRLFTENREGGIISAAEKDKV